MIKMGKADLHTHTTFSDGVLTPALLVERARQAGLSAVAITDHDTIDGVAEGVEAGKRFSIQVIAGVEINTDLAGTEVHMLGYFLDTTSASLRTALQNLREGRQRRAAAMVTRLNQEGVPVRLERVQEIAGGASAIGRPHVAQAIIELGYAADIGEAFEKYLGQGKPGYVAREKFTPEQAIAVIRAAGGVPVMAHPALSACDARIPAWVRLGMRGLEVDHSDHRMDQVRHYRRIVRDLGLVATAGSDFHGLPGSKIALGGRTCGMEVVARLEVEAERVRAALQP